MKKLVLSLLILILVSSMAFAERFWCINATTNTDPTGQTDAYRFNYSTVFDLSTYFNGTPIINDYKGKNNSNGKLDESRAIGTVGYSDITSETTTTYSGSGNKQKKIETTYAHTITYTIDTNKGKFVSQSDPSKYREFYVVIVPDYSTQGSTSRSFYYNTSTTAPSTKTNDILTFTDTNNYYSVGIDLFLCMDDPENERTHLSANDDYVANITVNWTCAYTKTVKTYSKNTSWWSSGEWKTTPDSTETTTLSCEENHSGSFNMMVRGYYGSNTGESRDTFLLVVNPTQESRNLNLKQMVLNNNESKQIADMAISTTTRKEFDWRSHIHAFLSANSNYAISDSNGFRLVNTSNRSITIPYTLTVYNTTSGQPGVPKVYDGKAYFSGNSTQYDLDLKDYSKSSTDYYYSVFTDLYGDTYYAINYNGAVDLQLQDFTIPGTDGVQFFTAIRNQEDYVVPYSKYTGKYESNIYYHIVYTDSPVNTPN